jgi:hypothetical protein
LLFRTEQFWLGERVKRRYDIHNGKLAAVCQVLRDLALRLSRHCNLFRDMGISRYELLNDSPALIEDLHKRLIVRQWADDEIPLVVSPDYVCLSLSCRHDTDT